MTWSGQIAHFRGMLARRSDEEQTRRVPRRRALHEEGAWQAIDNVVADGAKQVLAHGGADAWTIVLLRR